MSAPYSPAFGPSFAPGVAADSDSPSTSITRPSVYDQVLQSSSTSPAERTAQQQHEISSLRARLVEYRGEVEKLSLTSGLVLSLKSELRDGVLEELYSISVDLLDAKLQLQDVLEASVQEKACLHEEKDKLQTELQESYDELDECKREIFQFQGDLEEALVAVEEAKGTEEIRRMEDLRRLEAADSARALLQEEKDALLRELADCQDQCTSLQKTAQGLSAEKEAAAKFSSELAEELSACKKAMGIGQDQVKQLGKELEDFRTRLKAEQTARAETSREKETIAIAHAKDRDALEQEQKALSAALEQEQKALSAALARERKALSAALAREQEAHHALMEQEQERRAQREKMEEEVATVRQALQLETQAVEDLKMQVREAKGVIEESRNTQEAIKREVEILRREKQTAEERAKQDRIDAQNMTQQLAAVLEEDSKSTSGDLERVLAQKEILLRELHDCKQKLAQKQSFVASFKRVFTEATGTSTSARQDNHAHAPKDSSYHMQRLQAYSQEHAHLSVTVQQKSGAEEGEAEAGEVLQGHTAGRVQGLRGAPPDDAIGVLEEDLAPVSNLLLEGYTVTSNLLAEGYTVTRPGQGLA